MPLQTSVGNNAQTTEPVLAPTAVTIDGHQMTSPQATYQAAKAQRRELSRQMDALNSQRSELSSQLKEPHVTGADRKGLETHVADVDSRISSLQKALFDADAQVARVAGIPGAAIDPPDPPRRGPPEAVFVLGGMLIWIVFLPLSIAYARRIWKRGGQVTAAFPKEIADRMTRVEQVVESTAIEVERIGEGQRFMTRVLTENTSHGLAIGAGHHAEAVSPPGELRR